MAKVYGHLPKKVKIRSFVGQRIAEIEEQIEELNKEKRMWMEVIEITDPCLTCKGLGEVRVSIDQDHTRFQRCAACNGTGDSQK